MVVVIIYSTHSHVQLNVHLILTANSQLTNLILTNKNRKKKSKKKKEKFKEEVAEAAKEERRAIYKIGQP